MNFQNLMIFLFLLTPISSLAEVEIYANLAGDARTKTNLTVKHRKSGDCYTFGKGDDNVDSGAQIVSFGGEKTTKNSAQLTWSSVISSPFAAVVRTTTLDTQVTSLPNEDQVRLNLSESFYQDFGQIHAEKCRHTNGFAVTNNASIRGSVIVKYKVPQNVWAVAIQRQDNAGLFGNQNLEPMSKNVLNPAQDKGLWNGTILWVQPGQVLEQSISIPENIPGRTDLGRIHLTFRPLGSSLSEMDFRSFASELKAGKYSQFKKPEEAVTFLKNALGIIRLGEALTAYAHQIPLSDLKQISDELFYVANSVITVNLPTQNGIKPDGFSIKSAAAVASYQIARAILKDMDAYCKDVEVNLPFTGQKQKVLGLKAASFWLTRSMEGLRTYSYEPLEIFISRLKKLQADGVTPADIYKNRALRTELQNQYLLLTQTMSFGSGPLNRTYVDFNKLIATFPSLSSGETNDILAHLKLANQKETDFIKLFSHTVFALRPDLKTQVDYDGVLIKMADLKTEQMSLVQQIKASVRLLSTEYSEDRGQILNVIIDLLNNQINIFDRNLNINGFDAIRNLFKATEINELKNSANSCFELTEVQR